MTKQLDVRLRIFMNTRDQSLMYQLLSLKTYPTYLFINRRQITGPKKIKQNTLQSMTSAVTLGSFEQKIVF